jgi:hypothetical protein
VAHNVGDALTYHILTDETQTVIQRSVIRSRNDRHGAENKRVTFDPNLDPVVAVHEDNQNVSVQNPIMFSSDEIPLDRHYKRIRKKRVERGGQENHQATNDVICEIGEIDRDKDPLEPMDQGDVDLRRTSDLDDIDTAQGNRQFDTGTIENTGEENDNSIRRSSRKGKQPTRFANKVMVRLQCGYWRMRQGWLEFVGIGMFGFGMFGMGICGVGNFGVTLKLEISMWKFEVGMLFGYHGGYIRCMSHTIIARTGYI